MLAQVNDFDRATIDTSHVTNLECCDFPNTHSSMNAESETDFVTKPIARAISHSHNSLHLITRENFCLSHFIVSS
jgi:hypothetical protein